jgi:hypothetical protein
MHVTADAWRGPRADHVTVAFGATSPIVTSVEARTVKPGLDAKSTTNMNVFAVAAALCTLPWATHVPDFCEHACILTSARALLAVKGTLALGASTDVRGSDTFPPDPPLEHAARHAAQATAHAAARVTLQAGRFVPVAANRSIDVERTVGRCSTTRDAVRRPGWSSHLPHSS